MAKKLVVGADGSQSYVDTTPEEDAQAATDAAASQTASQAAATEAGRIATIKANARQTTLVTALTTMTDVQIIAAVAARYPALNGDAIKAVTDIALVLAVLAKR